MALGRTKNKKVYRYFADYEGHAAVFLTTQATSALEARLIIEAATGKKAIIVGKEIAMAKSFDAQTVAKEIERHLGKPVEVFRNPDSEDDDEVHITDAVHVRVGAHYLIVTRWDPAKQEAVCYLERDILEDIFPDIRDALRKEAERDRSN